MVGLEGSAAAFLHLSDGVTPFYSLRGPAGNLPQCRCWGHSVLGQRVTSLAVGAKECRTGAHPAPLKTSFRNFHFFSFLFSQVRVRGNHAAKKRKNIPPPSQ
jgi:hypothetical protein